MNYGARHFSKCIVKSVSMLGTILKGTKPTDLPVQQSTKFEFVINRGTAKVLRLGIPVMLRACASELID
jgi:putative tryptophan/tyrosine transport system substrate-binding protein